MLDSLYVSFNIDCEVSQPAVRDLPLGARAVRAFGDLLDENGHRATFHVLPSDVEAHTNVYRELKDRGHEIGLHVHPATDGYEEFLGVYGAEQQAEIIRDAGDRFSSALGFAPQSICIGYASTNDFTYGVLYDLGYRHGTCSIPSRVLPECASVHAGAPLDLHYANRHNRLLPGEMDFVEIPITVDPDSRMWGGKHPQDLRVELVDAKNHWYTIHKSVKRQVEDGVPIKFLRAITHNTFDYSDHNDFRRQTLVGMMKHIQAIAEDLQLQIVPATGSQIAAAYRQAVPLDNTTSKLQLDRRGYAQ